MISETGWKAVALCRVKFLFDEDEIVADEIEDLLNRQQRDGLPPDLRRTWACVERDSRV